MPPPGSRAEKATAWMQGQPVTFRLNCGWTAKDAGDDDPFAWQLAAWEAAGCPGDDDVSLVAGVLGQGEPDGTR